MHLQTLFVTALLLSMVATPMVVAQDNESTDSGVGPNDPCGFLVIRPHNLTNPATFNQPCARDWVYFVADLILE